MTFLHKLAQRLARMKTALLVGVVAAIACEIPLPVEPSNTFATLLVSPKALTTRGGQMADFVVVGLTTTGDTATVPVTWSVTGGTMVDTSTTGGKHLGKYKSPTSPGRYKVVAQSGGVADSAVVDVSPVPVAIVSVSPASASATVGQGVQLTATTRDSTGVPLSGRVVTWVSNNSAVAQVNATGLVTGVAAGAATITATSEGKNGTAAVTITPPPVASVIVSPVAVAATAGEPAQFTVTLEDAAGNTLTGRAVTWTSSNTGVATVNSSGLVTPVAAGLSIITATSEGKNGTAGITVTLTPAVVASVTVSPASANVTAGQTVQLTATVRDASGNVLLGRVVSWASSNTGLATVSGSGVVTGLALGTATITATSEGQSGSAAVSVTVPVAAVSVSPASASIIAGQTLQLAATPRDANGNALTGRVVTWASSNTGRATVNGNGLVMAVSTGTVTITATSEGKSGTAALTVTPVPVATVTVSPAAPSVPVGQTVQLTATPRDANGNVLTGRVITWSSSVVGIATVNATGLVTGVAAGSATITATSEGQSGSSAVSVTAPAPVASVSVSPASASVAAGQTVQLTATPRDANGNALTGRVVTWSSSNLAVASMIGSGLVSGVAVGSATITATSEGRSGTASITVTVALPPGNWPNEPSGMTVLTDLDFSGTIPTGQGVSMGGGWNINNRNGYASRVSDATAPFSAPNVFQAAFPNGFGGGTEPCNAYFDAFPGGDRKELYVAFWWKASNPWQGHNSGVNKLAFLYTGSGSGGRYAVVPEMFGSGNGPFYLRTALFELGTTEPRDWAEPNVGNGTLVPGVWYRLEFYMKYGTSSSSNNGVLKQWVNGVLVTNYTDLNYVNSGFDSVELSPTWGGVGDTKRESDYFQYDHIHVSGR